MPSVKSLGIVSVVAAAALHWAGVKSLRPTNLVAVLEHQDFEKALM